MRQRAYAAIRTTGIAIMLVMMPVIYVQILNDAKEKDVRLQTISNQVVDLKLAIIPELVGIQEHNRDADKEREQLGDRIAALERSIYRK